MEHSHSNRRSFLKSSTLAALGASHALRGKAALAEKTQNRPEVTGVPGKKLVGCYCSINEILDEPKYMDALQKELGVNVIIVRDGIKMPDWLKDMNPLRGKGWMGAMSARDDDDSNLVKAIDEVHRRGMDIWLYYTGMHYGQLHRPVCAETFDGIKYTDLPQIPYAFCQQLINVCFNKPEVVDWNQTVYTYGAKQYDLDAVYVTHFRYANPSFFTGLFGCGCEHCEETAYKMGYDFAAMKKAGLNFQKKIKTLDRSKIEYAAENGYTITDFLQLLADDSAIIDWLYFRAANVGMRMRDIRNGIHSITSDRTQFISDTHNPTLALYVGHNYADLVNDSSDGLMPLAWLDVQYMSAVAAWANMLVENAPGLSEETALTAVLKFFGWDDIPVERKSISKMGIGRDPGSHVAEKFYERFNPEGGTLALWTHEMKRLAMLNTKNKPSFPIIKGHQWTEKISRELMERCMSMGHTGYVLQRTGLFIDKEKL